MRSQVEADRAQLPIATFLLIPAYQMTRDGRFPKPVKISVRAVGWIKHEIQE